MMSETKDCVKAIGLHKHRVARGFALERTELLRPHMKVQALVDREKELNFRLLCDVFVHEAGATYFGCDVASWPADWWQAVKERFAPEWFLRRWPVEYATKTVSHKYTVYAVLPRVIKDQDHFFLYEFDDQPVMPE